MREANCIYRRIIGVILSMLLTLTVFASFFQVTYAEDESNQEVKTVELSASGHIKKFKSNVSVENDNTSNFSESMIFVCDDSEILGLEDTSYTFLRKFPSEYKGRITNINVKGYDFEYDEEKNALIIEIDKIGVADSVVFEISYVVTGINYLGEKPDVLDLVVLPDNRAISIDDYSMTVKFPENMKWNGLYCSIGDTIKKDVDDEALELIEDENKLIIKEKDIAADDELRVHLDLPSGYWANATSIGITKVLALGFLAAGLVVLLLLKLLLGKEPEIQARKEIYPPADLTPTHVGYLIDNSVDDSDILAMLYYLAERGYIKITEYERRKFCFTYLLYPKGETKSARLLFDAIFSSKHKGDVVKLCDVNNNLKSAYRKIRRTVPRDIFGENRFYSASSRFANTLVRLVFIVTAASLPFFNYVYIRLSGGQFAMGMLISIIVALVLLVLLENIGIEYSRRKKRNNTKNNRGVVISALLYAIVSSIYVYFYRFAYNGRLGDMSVFGAAVFFLAVSPFIILSMRSRSKASVVLVEKVFGLKDFMCNCSKDEILEISESDRSYYFKLMPYALVFNISRSFIRAFEKVSLRSVDWYEPYGMNGDYEIDEVIMNSMVVNLQAEMKEIMQK